MWLFYRTQPSITGNRPHPIISEFSSFTSSSLFILCNLIDYCYSINRPMDDINPLDVTVAYVSVICNLTFCEEIA